MLSPKTFRKALMDEHGVTTAAVAADVQCSDESVRKVVNGDMIFETPITKRIKALIADRVGVPAATLWPEEDDPRTSRATDPNPIGTGASGSTEGSSE